MKCLPEPTPIADLCRGWRLVYCGYVLGNKVPWVRDNLDIIFIAIVAVSVIPVGIELLKALSHRRKKKSSQA